MEVENRMEMIVLRTHRVGRSIRQVCIKAGVAPSTWSRWKSGAIEANEQTLDRLDEALDKFEAEQVDSAA